MNCDICNKALLKDEMTPISSNQLKKAVLLGWKESGSSVDDITSLARDFGLSDQELGISLFSRAFSDKTDWGLCSTCLEEFHDYMQERKNFQFWIIVSTQSGEQMYREVTGGWFPYIVPIKYVKDDISKEEYSQVLGISVFREKSRAKILLDTFQQSGKIPSHYSLMSLTPYSLSTNLVNLSETGVGQHPEMIILLDPNAGFQDVNKIFHVNHIKFLESE